MGYFIDSKKVSSMTDAELKDAFERGKKCLDGMGCSVYSNIVSDELENARRELRRRGIEVSFTAHINSGYGSRYF